jgi:hypothetical protein
MAAPVLQAGTPGNLINGVTVTHGNTIAALLGAAINSDVEFQVTCEVVTGATAPSVITTFGIYLINGNATPQTLSASSGASSVVLAAAAVGVHNGVTQKIALVQASGSKLGEIATVSAVSTSVVTFSGALINSYSSGDGFYLIPQVPTFVSSPSSSTGTYAASNDYSGPPLFLGPAQWIVSAYNGDITQSLTVYVTYNLVTAFQ